MDKGLWYVSLVLIVLGLALLAAGIALAALRREKQTLHGRADAAVTDLVVRESRSAGPEAFRCAVHPVLEFYAGGKLITLTYPRGWYPSRYKVGDRVRIAYDPDRPKRCVILEADLTRQIPSGIFAAGALMFLAGALIFVRFALRG